MMRMKIGVDPNPLFLTMIVACEGSSDQQVSPTKDWLVSEE